MKIPLAIFLGLTSFIHTEVMAQINKKPTLIGYESYPERYFDSVSKSLCQLNGLKNDFAFFTTFNVSVDGQVGPIEFVSIPGDDLPNVIKEHVQKLVTSTNGKWHMSEMSKGDSLTIVCHIVIVDKDETPEEKFETIMKLTNYAGDHPNDKNSKVVAVSGYLKKIFIKIER